MADIRVRINGQERALGEADTQWVHQSMAGTTLHADGHCVEVSVRADSMHVRLATCGCGGASGFRVPNAREHELCELWRRFRLGDRAPTAMSICEFLNALRRHFGLRAA